MSIKADASEATMPALAARTPATDASAFGGDTFRDAAAALKARHAPGLEAVGDVIVTHLDSSVALIPEVARHLIRAGGKRLRPLVTLAAAEACGYEGEGDTLLAAAVELIHAATLLHDDVVDDSALRRGLRTANIVFGNKESVLVGDFLFARAFELMVKTGSLRVLDVLSAASCTISEGEVLQLQTQGNLATDEAMYVEVIRAKTAALFGAAAQSAAALAGADPAAERALTAFGVNFGIAYQIVDDALDYVGEAEGLGKAAGDDFAEGKVTLPVILAVRAARGDEERAFWRRTVEAGDRREGDFETARRLIARDDLVAASLATARGYAEEAAASLSALPPSPALQALERLALASVRRSS